MFTKLRLFYFLLFIFFVISTLPARTALSFIPNSVGLKANGVSGSVWNGSAASLFLRGQSINNVEWSINPFYIFTGKVGGSVVIDDSRAEIDGSWKAGFDGTLYADNLFVKMNAEHIEAFLPMRNVKLQGNILAEINELAFSQEQGPLALDAKINWNNSAASIAGPMISLGNFSFMAEQTESNQTRLLALPSKNLVDLKGQLIVNWPSTVNVDFSMTEDVPEQLKSTIAFLKKGDDGRRVFQAELPLRR